MLFFSLSSGLQSPADQECLCTWSTNAGAQTLLIGEGNRMVHTVSRSTVLFFFVFSEGFGFFYRGLQVRD
jgi:hypothetical protein